MNAEEHIALEQEYISVLEHLSEVELYFSYVEVESREKNEKSEMLSNIIRKIVSKKFKVTLGTEKRKGNFDKWLNFWRNWQGNLTVLNLRFLMDALQHNMNYDKILPTKKWNEK